MLSDLHFTTALGMYSTALGAITTAGGYASTAMGAGTTATNDYSTALGNSTMASGDNSTAMGFSTTASGTNSTAMGYNTTASGEASTAMGYSTTASGFAASALGLQANASGYAATALGYYTSASGNYSTALGYYDLDTNTGSFVWSDNSRYPGVTSTNNNSVTMRASGGYRLFSNSGMTAGVRLAPNSTSWAVISDRNAKKDFAAVDSPGILEKLAVMPVTQWRYKWEDETVTPHIGPMAQDFKAAFYPGTDDTSITTLEADGVAFAAIQGLNQKLEARSQELEDRSKQLAAENAELKQSVAELKKLVQSIVDKK